MKDKAIVSMVCLTVLAITAMIMHINGFVLASVVGLIAGLGGYLAGLKKSNP